MPIQNKDTLAASVPTPPLGSTTLFTDTGLLKTKDDTGTVITLAAGGTVTSVGLTGTSDIGVSGSPITTSGAIAVSLSNTAVTPGVYTSANITVDAKGRITSAANGVGGGGTVTSVGITGSQGVTSGGGPVTAAGSITVGLGNITPVTVSTGDTTVAGNLLFTGNSRRIQGEFSGATIANRTMFQTSQVNGNTNLSIIPNGTGTSVFFNAENSSSPLNNSFAQFAVTATEVRVMSDVRGAGTQLPMHFIIGATRVAAFTPEFNLVLGQQIVLAPAATDGFVYLQTVSNTPTGTPTAYTGAAAQVVDIANNKFYYYSSGAWRNTNTPDYEEFVATAAQTIFNTAILTKAKAGTKSFLQVFVNGVFQQEGATKAFTVTGATQITFNAGVALNSDVVIYGYA